MIDYFIENSQTGLERYRGRPTPGNKIIDGYLANNGKNLDFIAKAISDMSRAVKIAERARFSAEMRVDSAIAALNKHFATNGEWNEKNAIAAVANFEKRGFGPKNVKAFVSFIRGMFFDDSDKAFQAIRCIGLSDSSCGGFTSVGATFEDSVTGNQFALMLPFTKTDRLEWRDWRGSVGGRIHNMPCYVLISPDDNGDPRTVSKNYDIREMRVAVAKFVAGGCIYTPRCARTEYFSRGYFSYETADEFFE